MSQFLMPTYNRQPIAFTKGQGVWLWDETGKQYLDALSGIAVCNLGHCHPKVVSAIQEQSEKLIHTSNGFQIPQQSALAEKLAHLSGLETSFFCNSGAEANETAIKIARLYGHQKGFSSPTIITMNRSFHGRTMAGISASGNPKIQAGFEPLVPGFTHIPFDDISALETALKETPEVIAVMLEPVQGEGGVHVPQANYLDQVRALCDQYNALMILDEIQSGIGRTGTWFAFQHAHCKPDLMTLAKGLGNGFPIGACMAKGVVAHTLSAGKHGTTFGGGPLASHVALSVLNTIEEEHVIENAAKMGDYLITSLQKNLSDHPHVNEVRGKGLWVGVELTHPCASLRTAAMEAGLIFNITAEKVIRLAPPLTITQTETDELVKRLCQVIQQFKPE